MMNVLFLSIGGFNSIEDHDQYPDLLRQFINNGHRVYVISSNEKRYGKPTEVIRNDNSTILKVKVGNITQSKLIEKGIATIMLARHYRSAIKRYFSNITFDLVLYTTPPITLLSVVSYIRERDNAYTYLILKDIFPQNAVDLGILSTKGIRGVLYRFFRRKEKELYKVSDAIGTMSEANKKYIINNNPEVDPNKVDICPNCLEIQPIHASKTDRIKIRKRYNIPLEKKVLVYGGNLGKPQNIPFIIECIKNSIDIKDCFFWIIGNGSEYRKIERFVSDNNPPNLLLSKRLPKEKYDIVLSACDIGLIFLDSRFTVPNFPSRLLGYLQAGIPVLACTDKNTDIGNVIMEGEYGWWCESRDPNAFTTLLRGISSDEIEKKASKSKLHAYDYSAENSYEIIINKIQKIECVDVEK